MWRKGLGKTRQHWMALMSAMLCSLPLSTHCAALEITTQLLKAPMCLIRTTPPNMYSQCCTPELLYSLISSRAVALVVLIRFGSQDASMNVASGTRTKTTFCCQGCKIR
jgi:hypothetical protein